MSSDAERRERYAAVMMQKWRDADWDVSEYDLADAAMAVADEEHVARMTYTVQRLTVMQELYAHVSEDNARLRAGSENDRITLENDKRYIDRINAEYDALRAENARLRDELESRARKIAQLVEETDRLSEERDRWQDTFFEQG